MLDLLVRRNFKRVLLIDDDMDISGALRVGFERTGISQLDVAADPFEAINMMIDKFYNFVILDWNLPALNGSDTLRRAGQAMATELDLPNQWDYQKVPVVIFSSSPREICIPKKNKHFSYVGFVSKNQPINQILGAMKGFIQKSN